MMPPSLINDVTGTGSPVALQSIVIFVDDKAVRLAPIFKPTGLVLSMVLMTFEDESIVGP